MNLGHVGFLAEAEREEIVGTVARVAAGDYRVEERMTLDVRVVHDGVVLASSWAVNEVSVEKANRERMLELVVDVDGRPLSSFGGTASSPPRRRGRRRTRSPRAARRVARGRGLLVVPISAHALFARPLVIAPHVGRGVEVLPGTGDGGVLWCDGRRTFAAPAGSRVEVRRSPQTVRLARLSTGIFTDRLVAKFGLPVTGWRGPRDAGGARS